MAEEKKNWFQAVKDYYNELKMEMRRVTWPTRKQVEGTTAVVIFSVFAFAAYFFVVDSVLGRASTAVFNFFNKR
jgi:preprotein translocase subunit SecE